MIKVITFNIKCGGANEFSIDHRAPLLKTVLDQYDGDVIGFQEATPKWMEYIEKDYGEEYEIFNHFRSKFSPESPPILWRKSRFECLDKGYFWLSDTPDVESGGWDTWGHNRICLWVELFDKQEGSKFTFFNTHYGFGDENQVKSGQLILNHFKAMKIDCGMLTADFNMSYGRPGYKLLEQHLVDANVATVNDQRHTCHGYNRNRKTGTPIDICFVTPETVVPLTAKRMDDLVNGEFPSDHYGFYFELQVRRPLHLLSFNTEGTSPRTRLVNMDAEVAALQEMNQDTCARLEKSYATAMQKGTDKAPCIAWDEKRLELVEKEVGERMALAVLKRPISGQRFCLIDLHLSHDEEEQLADLKVVLEKAKAYGNLPTILTGTFNFRIGSPAYRLIREQFEDLRRKVAPADLTPTYNGRGEEMNEPYICDYMFVRNVQPLKYEIYTALTRRGYFSDHHGIIGTMILED